MRSSRSMRSLRVFQIIVAAGNAALFPLNIAGHHASRASMNAGTALAMVLFAALFTTPRIHAIDKQNRPRPDYARIARLEREIFGEAFRHDGAPDDGKPQMGGFCLPAGPEFVIPRPASAEGYAYNCFKCQSTWRSDQFLGFCPDCDRKPGVTFEEFSRGMELLGDAIRNAVSSGNDSPAS